MVKEGKYDKVTDYSLSVPMGNSVPYYPRYNPVIFVLLHRTMTRGMTS